MRATISAWAASALLIGISNASPDANAVLVDREDTPPPQTVTVPAATTTGTIGGELTKHISSNGGVISTATIDISVVTYLLPAQTIVAEPIYKVTLCPKPTGSIRPPGIKFTANYGCPAGYVCNPPLPQSCNLWPGLPSDDFACNKDDCIPVPSFDMKKLEVRPGYQQVPWGFFHVDPRKFGLGYDLYEYGSNEVTHLARHDLSLTGKRQAGGSNETCVQLCNAASVYAAAHAGDEDLCSEEEDENGENFKSTLRACATCVVDAGLTTRDNLREYLEELQLDELLDVCEGFDPLPPSTTPSEDPVGSGTPSITSTTAGEPSSTGISIITPTTSSSEPSTSSSIPSTTSSSIPSTTSSSVPPTTSSSVPPTTSSSVPSTTSSSVPPTTSSSVPSTTSSSEPSTTSSSVPSTTSSSEPGTTSSADSTTNSPTSVTSSGTSEVPPPSGTLTTSASSSVEPSSSGSSGSPSTGSSEPSSTSSPESPSSTGSPVVPSTSSAEIPGSTESLSSVSLEPTGSSVTSGTVTSPSSTANSEPSETASFINPPNSPEPIGPSVSGVIPPAPMPTVVPTTQDTVIIPSPPTGTPGSTPGVTPPSSTGFQITIGATILTTLLTFLAVMM